MKKRFQNILMETRRKNGFSMVVCAFVLTLALGSLIGCSINEAAPDETEPSTQVWQSQPSIPMETEFTNMGEDSGETLASGEKGGVEPPDLRQIHVSGARQYCSPEEYPSLYEEVEDLLSKRQQVLASILGIDYTKLNMDETVTDEDGGIYYLLKEQRSLKEVRAELETVYTDDYIETDGAWYLTSLFREDQGKLYRSGGDGWADGLYDNWVIWEIDDTNYYVQGYTAVGAFDYGQWLILSIWTISRTDEGLRICSEQDISFLQNIYTVPEEDLDVGAIESGVGYVNTAALKVRREPYEDALVVGLLPKEKEVTILAEENEFYRISWQEGDGVVAGYAYVSKVYTDVVVSGTPWWEENETSEGYVRKEYIDIAPMYKD